MTLSIGQLGAIRQLPHRHRTGSYSLTSSYLYIDKTMQDDYLFKAICRTNRLDGKIRTSETS